VCVRWGGPLFLISCAAMSNAAVTSLWICSRYYTRSSTLCTRVCRYSSGLNVGWKLYHISKGDLWVLWYGHALWANLIIERSVAQLSCWKFLHMRRYCSSSWLTHSDSPSIYGWKAVDSFCLIPNFRQNSWVTYAANCGPWSKMIVKEKLVHFQTLSISN